MARCRTPGCTYEAEPEGKWCTPHREMYARMRTEIEAGKDRQNHRFIGSKCSYYDCPDPRKPGARFCLRHMRMLAQEPL